MRAGPTDGSPRSRPVADAPVEALVAGAEEVARAWLLELVASVPLSAMGGVRLEELSREGPELCTAVALALSDDAALAELRPGGELVGLAARAGALAGARDAVSASA